MGQSLSNLEHQLVETIENLPVGAAEVVKINGTDRYKCEVAQFLHRGFNRKFILIQEVSKEMLLAEKKAYGKVIRMMAHEVNNSLGATNSIVDTVKSYLEEKDEELDGEMADALALAIDRHNSLNSVYAQFLRKWYVFQNPNWIW